MGYIESGMTVWKEHCSTSDKLAGLNKLEGMYGDALDYIDSILHAERYYDKTETAVKYFTSTNDGSGSNLVCATLDGLTADQIIAAGTPSGCIAWWSGSVASIPAGWLLCNGANSTPNLRDRFIVGAGGNYAKGTYGNSFTVTTTGTVTVAGHALAADEIPKHTHGTITDYYSGGERGYLGGYSITGAWYIATEHTTYTNTSGSGESHSHTASWNGTIAQSRIPPYYALCIIMKS